MVEVAINQKRIKLSLSQFKELLFREEKVEPPKKKIHTLKIEFVLNNKEFLDKYGHRLLRAFVDYWTEQSSNGKKMRWQMQKAFDVSRRLKTWAKNDYDGHWKRHKEEKILKDQEEYYRRKSKEAEEFMSSEEQKKEIRKLAKGLFTHVKEM